MGTENGLLVYKTQFFETRKTLFDAVHPENRKDELKKLVDEWVNNAAQRLDTDTINLFIEQIGRKNSSDGVLTIAKEIEEKVQINPLLYALTQKKLYQKKSFLTGLLTRVRAQLN
mgnify:CR=1 FL=1